MTRGEREAAGEFVSAEVEEEIVDARQLFVEIDRRNAASRSDAEIPFDRHRQRRTVIAVRDPAGGQAENAAMPRFAGENQNAFAACNLLLRALAHLQLDRLPLGVHPIELRAELPRRVFIRRGEQIDRRVRRCEPSRRVDARTDLEADIYRT